MANLHYESLLYSPWRVRLDEWNMLTKNSFAIMNIEINIYSYVHLGDNSKLTQKLGGWFLSKTISTNEILYVAWHQSHEKASTLPRSVVPWLGINAMFTTEFLLWQHFQSLRFTFYLVVMGGWLEFWNLCIELILRTTINFYVWRLANAKLFFEVLIICILAHLFIVNFTKRIFFHDEWSIKIRGHQKRNLWSQI